MLGQETHSILYPIKEKNLIRLHIKLSCFLWEVRLRWALETIAGLRRSHRELSPPGWKKNLPAGQRGTASQSSPVYISGQGLGEQNAKMKSSRVRRTPRSDIRSSDLSVFMILSVANGVRDVRWSTTSLGGTPSLLKWLCAYNGNGEWEKKKKTKRKTSPEFYWLQTRQNIEWNVNLEV